NISNALSHPTLAAHLLRFQFLERDHLIAFNQLATLLVSKIISTVSDPLMDMSQRLLPTPVFVPLLRVFGRILEHLYALQVDLIAPVEARVRGLLAVRCRQERFKSHIYTDDVGRRRQALTLDLARKRHIPFASASAAQSDGFGRAFYRSVQDDMDR